MYNKKPLTSLYLPYYNDDLKSIVMNATEHGVETWQVNLKINKNGVSFIQSKLIKGY